MKITLCLGVSSVFADSPPPPPSAHRQFFMTLNQIICNTKPWQCAHILDLDTDVHF